MIDSLVKEFKKSHPPATSASVRVKFMSTDDILALMAGVRPYLKKNVLAEALEESGYRFEMVSERGLMWKIEDIFIELHEKSGIHKKI